VRSGEKDFRVLSASVDNSIRLWDPYDMSCMRVMEVGGACRFVVMPWVMGGLGGIHSGVGGWALRQSACAHWGGAAWWHYRHSMCAAADDDAPHNCHAGLDMRQSQQCGGVRVERAALAAGAFRVQSRQAATVRHPSCMHDKCSHKLWMPSCWFLCGLQRRDHISGLARLGCLPAWHPLDAGPYPLTC
jgi:hypothetical protein